MGIGRVVKEEIKAGLVFRSVTHRHDDMLTHVGEEVECKE